MPVDNNIRLIIDETISNNMSPEDLEQGLTNILEDILNLSSPTDILHTINYLTYRMFRELVRSANYDTQANYQEALNSALTYIYNDPILSYRFRRTINNTLIDERIGMQACVSLFNIHLILVRNAYLNTSGIIVDGNAPLRSLRAIININFGASRIRIYSFDTLDSRAYVREEMGSYYIVIGNDSNLRYAQNVTYATWNMQGEQTSNESKWNTHVSQYAARYDFLALQEVGNPPSSSNLIQNINVTNQFGENLTVSQYLWNTGTSTRPLNYHIYFYDTGRYRVRLAIIVEVNSPFNVIEPLIVSDGLDSITRPALGILVRGPANTEPFSFFSFHAISGGGINAPRMLREVALHSSLHFILSGDFNREPTNANDEQWVTPSGLAEIAPANGITHPGTNPAMLDYAVVQEVNPPLDLGIVENLGASDHYAVHFILNFKF